MSRVAEFLGRFRRNIPIALLRFPENFIIVSPIMAPRPQNHPPFKSLYIYGYMGRYVSPFCGCAAGRNVQPIAITFGKQFSLDVNKNWLVFGNFSPKRVEMVGSWNLKKLIHNNVNLNDTSLDPNGQYSTTCVWKIFDKSSLKAPSKSTSSYGLS